VKCERISLRLVSNIDHLLEMGAVIFCDRTLEIYKRSLLILKTLKTVHLFEPCHDPVKEPLHAAYLVMENCRAVERDIQFIKPAGGKRLAGGS